MAKLVQGCAPPAVARALPPQGKDPTRLPFQGGVPSHLREPPLPRAAGLRYSRMSDVSPGDGKADAADRPRSVALVPGAAARRNADVEHRAPSDLPT